MAGRLGGIKPGSSVGGKEGHRERQRALAWRRQRNRGARGGAWKHAGESKGGRRGKEERPAPGGVSPPEAAWEYRPALSDEMPCAGESAAP